MKNHVSYYRTTGNYNLCNSKDIEAQYIIDFGKWNNEAHELNLARGFTMPVETQYSMEDTTPLELIGYVVDEYKSYIYSSTLEHAENVLSFLDKINKENELEYAKHMKEKSEKELKFWIEKLNQLKK